jgi:uncharacterized membrane protein YqaE (UPF0057 family)
MGCMRLLTIRSDICKIIFAFILPPLGVFLERGCGADILINICLTILGWIPGIIHAMYAPFPSCLPRYPIASVADPLQLRYIQVLDRALLSPAAPFGLRSAGPENRRFTPV